MSGQIHVVGSGRGALKWQCIVWRKELRQLQAAAS